MSANAGQTVREILGRKKASIRQAPLDPGSPSWDDILDLTYGTTVGLGRRAWLNVDLVWAVAVLAAGVVTLFT